MEESVRNINPAVSRAQHTTPNSKLLSETKLLPTQYEYLIKRLVTSMQRFEGLHIRSVTATIALFYNKRNLRKRCDDVTGLNTSAFHKNIPLLVTS